MKILVINDSADEARTIEKAFTKKGVSVEVLSALTVDEAIDYLSQVAEIDIVFMDYNMGRGVNTVYSGLTAKFVEAGFGKGGKTLIANSSSQDGTRYLMEAGCNKMCIPHKTEYQELVDSLRQ